jgi:hypothetical protein
MPQLPHQDRLIDQVVLDNEDMRLRANHRSPTRGYRAFLASGGRLRGIEILDRGWRQVRSSRARLDEEAEGGAVAVPTGDLDASAHELGDLCIASVRGHSPLSSTHFDTQRVQGPIHQIQYGS